MKKFPIRQVHLDFHTSPHIPGIGSRFDKKQFQEALKLGKLESITVFAKCHHSMCYYPTKVGIMHPHLDFDLTGAMVEAAHEIGVRAPIYITAGWSQTDADLHPEWISVKPDGTKFSTGNRKKAYGLGQNQPLGEVAWDTLCLNDGSYCRHIYKLTEEICRRYSEVDGLFYDICGTGKGCVCAECVAGMKAEGLDPTNNADVLKYNNAARQRFMVKCTEIMRKYHPDATIFFNSGGADADKPQYHAYQTHYEMEDLPTAWGGYHKMPLRARFFRNMGKPYLGMTGKFHLAWGEFGGFKCKEALRYEVAAMAMEGAGCSVGDHMHPDGEMEMQTYRNIGYAFDYLEKIAPFCYGGASTANVGIVCVAGSDSAEGINKLLCENQVQYDVILNECFEGYDTVIIGEGVRLSDAGVAALEAYLAKGGKLLFFGDALVKDGAFQIDCGARYMGAPEYGCDYLFTDLDFRLELPEAPMLCTYPAQQVEATDARVLAKILFPYFNRTIDRFCGHKNTPHDKNGKTAPGILRKGNVVYCAHGLPTQYHTYGSLYHKRYFLLALEQIYAGGAFAVEGLGSVGRATMIRQAEQNRYCLNLIYAAPLHRGNAHVIEDILPIYNIGITLNVPETVKKAWVGTTGGELPVSGNKLVLPKLEGHASIVLEY